jgi:hypothetical protein
MPSAGMLHRVALVRSGVTSKKTAFFIVTGVKTSNHKSSLCRSNGISAFIAEFYIRWLIKQKKSRMKNK